MLKIKNLNLKIKNLNLFSALLKKAGCLQNQI